MTEKKIITTNSEILFIYDAEMTNPNGDPDNENKPRMDFEESINLVTDVRLKRYIRDYLELFENKNVYLTNPDGIVLNATNRLKYWKWKNENPEIEFTDAELKKFKLNVTEEEIVDEFIDVRLFGVTLPIKSEDKLKKGSSITFTGPIQFNWGKSLNKVEFVDSNTITTHLSSESGDQGSMGQDNRLYYSLISFHGQINAKRAELTRLTNSDLELFEKALIKSIPLLATRSKIGQTPRLYLRIEFKSNDYIFGDLRKYISLENKEGLRTIFDVNLNSNALVDKLTKIKDKIANITIWNHKDFEFSIKIDGITINHLKYD